MWAFITIIFLEIALDPAVVATNVGDKRSNDGAAANVWEDVSDSMKHFQFTKQQGLLVAPPVNNSPPEFFQLIADDDFYNLVVEETNKYAVDVFLSGIGEHSRITKWKPLTVPELRIFFGLLLHMGTIRINRIQDCWKTHPFFNLQCFSDHMGRDQPGKNLSLDESMVLWRGRLIFRQFIKNKRHKYGIKFYMLTEPDGLVLNVSIYTGALDAIGGKGHAKKFVLHLMKDRLHCGHSLFMDNFYNSFELAQELIKNETYCIGILRADRKGNPKEVVSIKLNKGETKCKYCDDVMIGKWRDKRDVLYISTEFQNDMTEYENKRGQMKNKPLPILKYNENMSGIDRQDQIMSYYPCDRKTLRWYKKNWSAFCSANVIECLLFIQKNPRKQTCWL